MRRASFLPACLLAACLLAGPAGARETIGVYGQWAAFRDLRPPRCFAIAAPVREGSGAFASVADWPGRGIRRQLHVRLSRAHRRGTPVTLAIDERRITLVAAGSDAWGADPRADAAIVAAMRSGRSMSVSAVSDRGAPFADGYSLRGAPSAVDAATLACRRSLAERPPIH